MHNQWGSSVIVLNFYTLIYKTHRLCHISMHFKAEQYKASDITLSPCGGPEKLKCILFSVSSHNPDVQRIFEELIWSLICVTVRVTENWNAKWDIKNLVITIICSNISFLLLKFLVVRRFSHDPIFFNRNIFLPSFWQWQSTCQSPEGFLQVEGINLRCLCDSFF